MHHTSWAVGGPQGRVFSAPLRLCGRNRFAGLPPCPRSNLRSGAATARPLRGRWAHGTGNPAVIRPPATLRDASVVRGGTGMAAEERRSGDPKKQAFERYRQRKRRLARERPGVRAASAAAFARSAASWSGDTSPRQGRTARVGPRMTRMSADGTGLRHGDRPSVGSQCTTRAGVSAARRDGSSLRLCVSAGETGLPACLPLHNRTCGPGLGGREPSGVVGLMGPAIRRSFDRRLPSGTPPASVSGWGWPGRNGGAASHTYPVRKADPCPFRHRT